jgi:hypothetical protein
MKKRLVALLVPWLGAIVAAAYLWQQLGALRDENVALQAQVTALASRKAVAATGISQMPVAEAAAAPVATAPPSVVKHGEPSSDEGDFRQAMARASFPIMYPDLGKELGLTPDELDKFEALLTRHLASPTFGASPAERSELAQLLGDKYPRWQAYQDSLPGRQQVSLLRGRLVTSGNALSDEKAQLLTAALNVELKRADLSTPRPAQPSPASSQEARDRDLQGIAEVSSRLVKAATPYLNAQQLEGYRQMLDQQMQMARMTMDVMQGTQNQSHARN